VSFCIFSRLILPTPHSDFGGQTTKNHKIALFFKHIPRYAYSFVFVGLITFTPQYTHASFLSFMGDLLGVAPKDANAQVEPSNIQNMQILQASVAPTALASDMEKKIASTDMIIEKTAISTETGPLGTVSDVGTDSFTEADTMSIYVVRKGDTVAQIAEMFDVSANTILWANDLKKGQALTENQVLVILPVSGIQYTVKKGDTIKGIAKALKADPEEIIEYNGFVSDVDLIAGTSILVPNGEIVTQVEPKKKTTATKSNRKEKLFGTAAPDAGGNYYIRPIVGGRKSQGLHGYNSIDLAAPQGTPIMASASGTVLIARTGYNGGYGNYVVLSHPNGSQTLYGHMKSLNTSSGQSVSQGQIIGYVGNTGRSTGPHVHFEVRGAKNPGGVSGVWER
jgi:LysM repeat protein